MTGEAFGYQYIETLVARISQHVPLVEHHSAVGGPCLDLVNEATADPAGWVRLWQPAPEATQRIDRIIHCRLLSAPVDTQLLFVFGRADSPVPHFHAQVVQFAPDACVYNADIIPRLDPVDHPRYFREVFGPVTKAYWRATTNRANVCAMAPANPAISAYLSPWSIAAGRPTTREELDRVAPSIIEYLDHMLVLARDFGYDGISSEALRERDRRHMSELHSDELDPRAWKGVYGVVGTAMGLRIKSLFASPLR